MVRPEQPSAALQEALQLFASGRVGEAEVVVKKAAMAAKARYGSGSHPLARAYADIARLHLRTGAFQKAAVEFQHASKGPMPAEAAARGDRLDFMFGYAEALVGLARYDDAEKVLRQCVTFARSLYGVTSAAANAANAPLADVLLKTGKTAEAMKLVQDSYNALWALGDPLITAVIPVRAEALKASGRPDSPFTDLTDLPEELVSRTVAAVIARAPVGDAGRMRVVLADLLQFVDTKYGDGHAVTCDVLAAIAHHESRQGDGADPAIRRTAVRRSVWSYAVRRAPAGLLANLEVAFEPDGALHLVPHLAREANGTETAQLQAILTQAVDDLYSRPGA